MVKETTKIKSTKKRASFSDDARLLVVSGAGGLEIFRVKNADGSRHYETFDKNKKLLAKGQDFKLHMETLQNERKKNHEKKTI